MLSISKTQLLYWIYRGLGSPLEAMFTLLIFIISKELNATPLQLTILACLKPVVSLIAFQSNSWIIGKMNRSRTFLMLLTFFGAAPCLMFPFVTNAWFYIASYGLFMTSLRASSPAWIEILKCDLGLPRLGKTAATGSAINYFVIMFIPLLVTSWMDLNPQIWKFLFVGLSILQLLNLLIVCCLTTKVKAVIPCEKTPNYWLEGWKLLKTNSSFTQYQILFFLGGAGLVMVQPVLPIYFKDTLHLSYTQLGIAFSFCKGISFVLSSPLWAQYGNRISLYFLNCIVNTLSCLFITFILASSGETNWLFLAYLMYGSMQAGCELSWNLSGPTFAKEKESTLYSNVNLAFVGLRGCICPFLGQFIFMHTHTLGVFTFAGSLCFIAIAYALWLEYTQHNLPIPVSNDLARTTHP